ncbi:MAG: oligopeptide:H+ symporter, partial [Fusobacterium sp.]
EMFLIAGLMAALGTTFFILAAPKYLGEIGRKPFKKISEQKKSNIFTYKFSDSEKKRIKAMGITAVFAILFWTSFYQSFSSITLYARDHVNRNLGNFNVPVPWFAALNSILGIVLAPVIAEIWRKFGSRGFTTPVKMAVGIFSMGTAFVFMTASVLSTGGTENGIKASMIFIVFAYLFNTISELCIAPIGIAMFNRLAPKRFSTFFMGMWYMTMFVASFISGRVAGYTQNAGFFTIFASLSTILFVMGIILFKIRKYLNKLMLS